MAVFEETKTISPGPVTPLHTSVAKRCSVEILEGRDSVVLSRRLNGVNLDLLGVVNSALMTVGQTIPIGVIRASDPVGGSPVQIRYRVRTGKDFTGAPELPN